MNSSNLTRPLCKVAHEQLCKHVFFLFYFFLIFSFILLICFNVTHSCCEPGEHQAHQPQQAHRAHQAPQAHQAHHRLLVLRPKQLGRGKHLRNTCGHCAQPGIMSSLTLIGALEPKWPCRQTQQNVQRWHVCVPEHKPHGSRS